MVTRFAPRLYVWHQQTHRLFSSFGIYIPQPVHAPLRNGCRQFDPIICSRQLLSHRAQSTSKLVQNRASNVREVHNARRPLAGSYQTAAQLLARRPGSALLYMAPSHARFVFVCYLFSGFCFTYAGICFSNYVLRPPGFLSKWLQYAYAGITLFVSMAGLWSITRVSCRQKFWVLYPF